MRRNRREQLNEYWRSEIRERRRRARLRAEAKAVDPQVFLSNPQLLQQVKTWIDIAGVDYARRSLAETGVASPNIDKIIEAALGKS